MPQIDTPDNFDFSKDQHRLALVEDLKRLARLIGNLEKSNQVVEDDPAAAPVYPAVYSPCMGNKTFKGLGFAGDGAIGSFAFHSLSSGSFSGYSQTFFNLTAPGATSYDLWQHNQYAPSGTTNKGLYAQDRCNQGGGGGAGSWVHDSYAWGALPPGLSGWSPSAIELDFELYTTGPPGTAVSVTLSVTFNGGTVKTAVYSSTIPGSGALSTGFVTLSLTNTELSDPSRDTPGALMRVALSVVTVYEGTNENIAIGQLRLNWN